MYWLLMLDDDRIQELRRIMGAQFRTLIAQALADTQAPATVLTRVTEGSVDAADLGFALHTLHGIASNIGCTEISALCAEGLRALDTGAFDPDIARLITRAVDACRAQMTHHLSA